MTEARLARIEALMERCLTQIQGMSDRSEERAEKDDEWRASVDRTLHGVNGHIPGVVTRVDRLEQNTERFRWLLRAVSGALFAAISGGLWAWLRGR
jgi:hypothetical protein